MSAYAIVAEGVGKQYRLNVAKNHFPTLRETLASSLRSIGRSRGRRDGRDHFWALRDVSFRIGHGEITGVIGRNGAGKSTLLKILSRVTRPTTGSAQLHGRVAALLEVGIGFHPELTGRENILLNGAILGMKQAEVRRKFDAIVSFAGIEKFIETPLKHYSSGMYLRLAFAVAAHLDPEILLVDEVLAVGDAEFQKRCLSKMNEAALQGRTVLFVSHNLGAVQTLCKNAILLRNGSIAAEGKASEVVASYLRTLERMHNQSLSARTDRGGKGDFRLSEIDISSADGYSSTLASGRPARFTFHVPGMSPGGNLSFVVFDSLGCPIICFDSAVHGAADSVSAASVFVCEIGELLLVPGRYRIDVGLYWRGELQDDIEGAAFIDVEQGEVHGRPVPDEVSYGSSLMAHRWISPASS